MEDKFKLPKEFAEKWVSALRSGEYEQGKDVLFRHGKYCCLGVAEKVCGYTPSDWGTIQDCCKLVPFQIRGSMPIAAEVSGMNDSGKTFLEIADWIEQNCEFI